VLDFDQGRYLTLVMRQGGGDAVLLFNGRDGEWRAIIVEAAKKVCRLRLEQRTREQVAPPALDLVIALVKRARLEAIIEKATELGVGRIRLAITRRTQADHTNLGRLQAIAAEAAEQTGRLDAPQILAPEKLERMLTAWDSGRRLMFCDEAGDDPEAEWGGEAGRALPVLDVLSGAAPGDPWAILIGPEGGFAPEERQALRQSPFVAPVTLGPRILRADTAALAALTLWQAALGDWRAG
jgi:16S rRNA (uracil1498-N3)-methyltransferase